MSVFGARPTVLGHRGLGRDEVDGLVENSVESIVAAARCGLRWVEFDVRRTADDRLVVGHYPTVGDAEFVADLPLERARELGAVTLEEVLEALPAGTGVNLDLKTSMEDAVRPRARTTAAVLAPVATEAARDRPVLVSSFDPSALLVLGELAPDLPRSLLTWISFPLRKALPAAAHLGVDAVAAHWSSFGPNPVDRAPAFRSPEYAVGLAHEAGLEVVAWCPKVPEARSLLTAGVDAVVVDDVPRTLPALAGLAD
ncbi:glycerophosphodiester phosphodiesterase [Phycicoccus ginsengisoli]